LGSQFERDCQFRESEALGFFVKGLSVDEYAVEVENQGLERFHASQSTKQDGVKEPPAGIRGEALSPGPLLY
jgi:hypothetical protein